MKKPRGNKDLGIRKILIFVGNVRIFGSFVIAKRMKFDVESDLIQFGIQNFQIIEIFKKCFLPEINTSSSNNFVNTFYL